MANKKKNKRERGERERIASKNSIKIAPARKRLPTLFRILDDVIEDAVKRFYSAIPDGPFEESQWVLYNRGFNCVKALKVLTEVGHWEGATGLARQMFELSVNIEFMFSSANPESAALRFSSYGALQQMLYFQHLEQHYVEQGYAPRLGQEVADSELEQQFPEFRAVNRKGKSYWIKSWTGKSLRDLVDRSTVPQRKAQYNLLFSSWSEQVHATPGSFAPSFIRRGNEDWVAEMVLFDDRKTYEVIANSINILFEITLMLPVSRPTANRSWLDLVRTRLQQFAPTLEHP